jgi:hypothetical protein
MTRLWGVFVNGTAARDALARWQFGMVFDSTDQQIECVLRMGLDKFELRECQLEGFSRPGRLGAPKETRAVSCSSRG